MSNHNGNTDSIIHTNGASEAGAGANGAVLATLQDVNAGTVRAADIVGEMQTAYLDYAMSVIVARALPDVRDGLKPVHRRILYAVYHDLSLTHDKPHKKSARIVGEVLGKYHPHGDVAVYDAMVRMAQDFSLRYPLIDGQGNFGSIDGDNAAAMRYTEARLAEISDLMLEDLDRDTVGWHPNFDSTLREPDVLPSALPNLLINGASGIAVGMATNVPPHNLGEIVDALAYIIDNYEQVDDITVEKLMEFVKGPDFPTGGILYRYRQDKADENTDAIAQGYAVGKSRLMLQAKAHFEEMSRGRMRIVVTELPYQTNKTALIERIASLVREEKLVGLTDLRDESDRTGMRIVIELTRNADPKAVLTDLFKYTPLQQTFGMQLLALVDGQPRILSLKRALHLFIQHREEIVRRRSEFELAKAKARAHIVEGLLHALDILDEVINTIRHSQNADTARANLMKNFQFSEVQAQAILDMQLRRLAALERKKLKEEFDELKKRVKYLEGLLADPTKILQVIKDELLALREKYADARRTQIVDRTKGTLTTTDLLPQQDVWVAVAANGDLMRQDVVDKPTTTTLRQLGKGGQVAVLTTNTRDWLYLFSRDGRCARLSVHEIPQDGNPKHLSELCGFTRRDVISAAITLPRENGGNPAGYLFCATEQGMVKRVTLADFLTQVTGEFTVINVDDKDGLGWVLPTPGTAEIMLVTAFGQSIRFGEEDVRSMGLAAAGVGGMKLERKDKVVYGGIVAPDGTLVTITTQGYAKQSTLADYSRQGRNGSGIVTHKLNARTGDVATALVLPAGLEAETPLLATNHKAVVKQVTVGEIPMMGRGVQGKLVLECEQGERMVAVKRLLDKGSLATPPETNGTTPAPKTEKPLPTNGATKRTPAIATVAPSGSPVNGKQAETASTQPAAPSVVTAEKSAPATKRNFVAAQAGATPIAEEKQPAGKASKTTPPTELGDDRAGATLPVKPDRSTAKREQTVNATTPKAESAIATPTTPTNGTNHNELAGRSKSKASTQSTPVKLAAQPAIAPTSQTVGATPNGKGKSSVATLEGSKPEKRATLERTPQDRSAPTQVAAEGRQGRAKMAQTPTRETNRPAPKVTPAARPETQGAKNSKPPLQPVAEQKMTGEAGTAQRAQPRKTPPTQPSQLKLTAPKAASSSDNQSNGVMADQGKSAEKRVAGKTTKAASEAKAQPQTMELFPVAETDIPKNKPPLTQSSKLAIAVSVNRPAKK